MGLPRKMDKKHLGANTLLSCTAQKKKHIALLRNSLTKKKVEITVLSRIHKDKLLFTRRGTEDGISQSMLCIFVRERHVQTDPSPSLSSTFSCCLLPDLLFYQQFVILQKPYHVIPTTTTRAPPGLLYSRCEENCTCNFATNNWNNAFDNN